MDQAQLSAIMKSFGAADTPENSNRVREFYAADPTAADRRQFGARGQSDESGGSRDAILNSMLDKVMALTDKNVPPSVEATTMPMVQNTSVPTRKSATAAPKGTAPIDPVMNAENPNLGPVPARNASSGERAASPEGIGFWDTLALLLGGGATAGAMMRSPPTNANANARGSGAGGMGSANRAITGPNQNTLRLGYEPKLEDQDYGRVQGRRVTEYPSGAPVIPEEGIRNAKGKVVAQGNEWPKGTEAWAEQPKQSPQDIARMQAEIEAENAASKALQEQMMQQTQAQKRTSDLSKAARRATGRK